MSTIAFVILHKCLNFISLSLLHFPPPPPPLLSASKTKIIASNKRVIKQRSLERERWKSVWRLLFHLRPARVVFSVCLFFSSLWWTDPMHLHSSERECEEGLESSLRILFLFITLINVMAQSHCHSHQRLGDLQSSDEFFLFSVVFFKVIQLGIREDLLDE